MLGDDDSAIGMFETGYPYIGLSEPYFDKIAQILERNVEGMNCTKGFHWGLCRVAEKQCENIKLDHELMFTINDYDFTIPL